MLADRQTTGGYPKIAVLCSDDVGALGQRMPGESVRFVAVGFSEAIKLAKEERRALEELRRARSTWRSRPRTVVVGAAVGDWRLTVSGKPYVVTWTERV